MKANVV